MALYLPPGRDPMNAESVTVPVNLLDFEVTNDAWMWCPKCDLPFGAVWYPDGAAATLRQLIDLAAAHQCERSET